MGIGRGTLYFYIPILLDLLIVICTISWVSISVDQYESRKTPCREKYTYEDSYYYSYSSCVNRTLCQQDNECDLYSTYSGYDYSCYSDCSSCECYPAQKYFALEVTYLVFFSLAMVLEVVKGMILFCNSINGQCCCCDDGKSKPADDGCCGCCDHHSDPVEKSCLRHITDSWVMIAVAIFHPINFRALRETHEKGILPVSSFIKGMQWICRDIILGILMSLYVSVLDYFNIWFALYVAAVVLHWFSLRQRAMWNFDRTTNPTPITKEKEGIEALPPYMQQQQQQPYPVSQLYPQQVQNKDHVTVYYNGPTPPKVYFQPVPLQTGIQQQQQQQGFFSTVEGSTTQ